MSKIQKGDYVLATKWHDGDPHDPWGVGLYDREEGGRHFITFADGRQIRANGYRRVGKISQDFGLWMLSSHAELESYEPGSLSIWDLAAKHSPTTENTRRPS